MIEVYIESIRLFTSFINWLQIIWVNQICSLITKKMNIWRKKGQETSIQTKEDWKIFYQICNLFLNTTIWG